MKPLQDKPLQHKSGSELAALTKGRQALACHRLTEASAWLDRACRLAPHNAAIKLLRASSLAGVDDRQASCLLEEIVSAHPTAWTAAWLLAKHAYRIGEVGKAVDLLSNMLSRSVVPVDASFGELAACLAEVSGRPGWTGLSQEGALLLSVASEVWLDGVRLKLRTVPVGDRLFRARLSKNWREACRIEVIRDGRHLLGSPIDVGAQTLVQGFVELALPEGSSSQLCVKGWAWMPGSPHTQPSLRLMASDCQTTLKTFLANEEDFKPSSSDGVAWPRGFTVDVAASQESGPIHVVDFLGRDLFGSPLDIASYRSLNRPAEQPAPVVVGETASQAVVSVSSKARRSATSVRRLQPRRSSSTRSGASRRALSPPVDIVIPVFNGAADFLACLESVRKSRASDYRLVVVDDASRDCVVHDALVEAAEAGAIIMRQPRNKGFPAAVNVGLRHAMMSPGELRDVVLLNPDTLVTPGWLDRMRTAAYASDDIGSVTPMTNDGSIVSYPSPGQATAVADQAETDLIASLFEEAYPGIIVDVPTAVGFCMYIRHDCLTVTGLFREDLFAQGYAEENDWCVRAVQLGWRHVVDAATFVCHIGGRSFGPARQDLMARNLGTLSKLHPGYDANVCSFLKADPLKAVRRNADTVRWRRDTCRQGSAILITHTLGGGVERHVRARSKEVRAQGLRPVVLRPPKEVIDSEFYSELCHVAEEDAKAFPNLLFRWDEETSELLQLLRHEKPRWIEIHHLVGHQPQVLKLPELLGLPYDVVLHDFALVCPRISMCGGKKAYCGEPTDVRECETCVIDNRGRLAEEIGAGALRDRTTKMVAAARRLVAPTHDTARRFSRYVTAARVDVQPWEDDLELSGQVRGVRARAKGEAVRVCVVGAIGEEKGYDVLLACARDAAHRELALSFNVVGHTIDDSQLIDTDRVFVTGYYEEDECLRLIKAQDAAVGFLPSVWPEPWCYALSALWRAALWPVVFDIGGHAERVRRTGKGTLLPIGMPAKQMNDALLALVKG